jgi:hypothetical protein
MKLMKQAEKNSLRGKNVIKSKLNKKNILI